MNAIVSTQTVKKSWYRLPVLRTLASFDKGYLLIELPGGEKVEIGDAEATPRANLWVRDEAFFKKCALGGGVGLGEAYMDGDWDTENIRDVIAWFICNLHANDRLKGSSQRFHLVGWLRGLDRVAHRLRHNSKATSRKNIEEHYDLGNDFYRLWLDPTMTYSSARFSGDHEQALEEAQRSKYQALAEKLQIQAEDHVLEIGCGWGGFACFAAERYGCRVTGVTISPAQYEEAQKRVKASGLEDRVEIVLRDYRELTGTFDKIASIEMLEAVGHRYHPVWARQCHRLLKPDGRLAVQMITVPDGDYAMLKKGADFIQKHIFPGSLLLSVGRMNEVLREAGQFSLFELEDLGMSYARTLASWHERFNAELDQVRALGFSERFIRKWNYYLKYCEAAFATRNISVVQAVYLRPHLSGMV
jgi:cyclopropane-fatty-acyl-phospholipid synthase